MIKKTPEWHSKRMKPETYLEKVMREYLGSEAEDLGERILDLVNDVLRNSRSFREIAKDLLGERCRQYDLKAELIDEEMLQSTIMSLLALNSFASHIANEKELDRIDKLAEIRDKIRATLAHIDSLILKQE